MCIAELVDVVVICSGDGDFIPLVEYLQHRGRIVEVASFRPTTSGKMQDLVDEFIDLAADLKRYVIRRRQRRGAADDEEGGRARGRASSFVPVLVLIHA